MGILNILDEWVVINDCFMLEVDTEGIFFVEDGIVAFGCLFSCQVSVEGEKRFGVNRWRRKENDYAVIVQCRGR